MKGPTFADISMHFKTSLIVRLKIARIESSKWPARDDSGPSLDSVQPASKVYTPGYWPPALHGACLKFLRSLVHSVVLWARARNIPTNNGAQPPKSGVLRRPRDCSWRHMAAAILGARWTTKGPAGRCGAPLSPSLLLFLVGCSECSYYELLGRAARFYPFA
jgi:hypothetical protein